MNTVAKLAALAAGIRSLSDETACPRYLLRMPSNKGTIAILTGGGDVPGLNPAIRAITIRALREGYRVVGIRRGWAGLVDYVRDDGADNTEYVRSCQKRS